MKKWNRLKEIRFKETTVSYTSDCEKYCINKVYAYDYNDSWGVDIKEDGNWKRLKSFESFKDAKQFANNL